MSEKKSVLSLYPDYEVVIGIEVHVQLNTKSKIFCSCANQRDEEAGPNSTVCPICTGHPGTLPVLNEQVIEYGVRAGIATQCTIQSISIFDRKHYFYPDLPKGYQITQQYQPICKAGHILIKLEDGSTKKIRINRIHIEEDAGKSMHAPQSGESFVDLNRAGTPLLEIVSYPDISSTFEARAYLKSLRLIVMALDICTGDMEKGAFRADTNISVRKKGAKSLGTKCELKNINSFKFIGDAIEYEIERQIELITAGGAVSQETRLWDTKNKQTIVMRTKEEAADYRYFPDPDLPPVVVTESFKAAVKAKMPELPHEQFDRFMKEYGLSAYEAGILIDEPELGTYFQEAIKKFKSTQLINWILRDVVTLCKENKIPLAHCVVTPTRLAIMMKYLDEGKLNSRTAKELFERVAKENKDPEELIAQFARAQISLPELEKIVQNLIKEFPEQVQEYKSGKTKLIGFFVGKIMEHTKGAVNPPVAMEVVKKILG